MPYLVSLYLIFISIITTLSSSIVQERVFYCNFDNGTNINTQCGGSVMQMEGTTFFGITQNENVIYPAGTSVTVTDVKSITFPTLVANEKCQIPYTFKNNDQYFCVQNSTKYVCDTGRGQFYECVRGNFLRVRTLSSGVPILGFFNVTNPIKLPAPGKYKMTLYTSINCPKNDCNKTGDTLFVRVRDGPYDYFEKLRIGAENGRIIDKKWVKEEINFETETDEIYLRIDFYRETSSSQVYFFVDEISIFTNFDEPETTGSDDTTLPLTNPKTTTTTSSTISKTTTDTTIDELMITKVETKEELLSDMTTEPIDTTTIDGLETITEETEVVTNSNLNISTTTSVEEETSTEPSTTIPVTTTTTTTRTTTTTKTTSTTTKPKPTTRESTATTGIFKYEDNTTETIFLSVFLPLFWIGLIAGTVLVCIRWKPYFRYFPATSMARAKSYRSSGKPEAFI